ncbi:hypothetical protein TRVA0_003S02454 [Trichomonascus vanleenenianus]|uniref:uncharacterized protein n=1 Tax=Trichomonascus vanleenenianus TaxID=2268995 RepID=UPI003ECA73D0
MGESLDNKRETNEHEDGETEQDYFSHKPKVAHSSGTESPAMMLTRPDLSNVDLNEDGEEQMEERENIDEDDEEAMSIEEQKALFKELSSGSELSRRRAPFSLEQDLMDDANVIPPTSAIAGMLDVGIYTSGGLAPGASNYTHVHPANESTELRSLRARRDELFRSIGYDTPPSPAIQLPPPPALRTGSQPASPRDLDSAQPSARQSIELKELDSRLKRVQVLEPEKEKPRDEGQKHEEREIARQIVQSHALHLNPKHLLKRRNSESSFLSDSRSKKSQVSTDSAAPIEFDQNGYVVKQNAFVLPNAAGNDLEYGAAGEQLDPTGTNTPRHHEDYVAPPKQVRQGVLGSLLKLYGNNQDETAESSGATSTRDSLSSQTLIVSSSSAPSSPQGDGKLPTTPTRPPGLPRISSSFSEASTTTTTSGQALLSPKEKKKRPKWHKHKPNSHSMSSLALSAAQTFAAPGAATASAAQGARVAAGAAPAARPSFIKRPSGFKKRNKARIEEQIRITVHIADVLQRQRFILRICRALMLYGAPTHRLEEYLKMTSRVLEINGQYLYIPGCMVVSFDDATTHTSEMQIVRVVQGLNLSKLQKTHQIYKEVVHDIIGVEEASQRVDELLSSKNRYPNWLCIIFFGLASAMITPAYFGGWWADMPIAFILGSAIGVLQIVVAPRSDLYSNVFEVTSSIIVAFLGRAFGAIGGPSREIFCFSGITQGSLAMILPGYIILCGSLELQSKNIVSGSVRMFYAIIYSLFLGFGISLGAAIYGWIDRDAPSSTQCARVVDPWWKFLLIPLFAIFIAQVNQANLRQLPIMTLISSAGYAVTYFLRAKVSGSSDFVSAVGAFVIGLLGNMYSRFGHGLAFAAMLPAIFVQVPNAVASQGSFLAGIENANSIVNGTRTVVTASNGATVTQTLAATPTSSAATMSLGTTMVQVCIGITVGLFVATLVIYPFGKKRSGLFTF